MSFVWAAMRVRRDSSRWHLDKGYLLFGQVYIQMVLELYGCCVYAREAR